MPKAPLPPDEEARMEALHRYRLLDTGEEEIYDNLTRLAAHLCGTPLSLVTLIDGERQWFKSHFGTEIRQTSRDLSFCAHAILGRDVLLVPDARDDARFADNPLVTGDPNIQFYAGAPLISPEGHRLGTLCVLDRQPHTLTPGQAEILQALARHVVCQMEAHSAVAGQAMVLARLEQAQQAAQEQAAEYEMVCAQASAYIFETVPDTAYLSSNTALARFYGYESLEELTAMLPDI